MHLLNVHTLNLKYFEDSDVPLYAIFLYTWKANEVTHQDVQRDAAEEKAGYEKLKKTCRTASTHGFKYDLSTFFSLSPD